MRYTPRRWLGIGLTAALLVTPGLVGCSPASDQASGEQESRDLAEPGTAPEIAPTHQGEGGEGGVDVDRAATDPAVYLAGLGVIEAHVLAGRDAYREGAERAGGEMFAHPVSEVYFDLEPAFETLGVAGFDQALMDASALALSGAPIAKVDAATDAILATLDLAAGKAPGGGNGDGGVLARVVADQIDRAARQYVTAGDTDALVPYLDGYGYAATARRLFDIHREVIVAANPDAARAIEEALVMLDIAYPSAMRPANLSANASQLQATASGVILTAGGL
jgi:hypothetical protein